MSATRRTSPLRKFKLAVDEWAFRVMFAHFVVVDAEIRLLQLLRVQQPEADLVELGAFAHPYAKAARRDFGVERSLVAAGNPVKDFGMISDEAGENIEAAG